jgi:hypothetical protein
MKSRRSILNLVFIIVSVLLVCVLNFVDLTRLPFTLPDSTVLVLSVAYVVLWVLFSIFSGIYRSKTGWVVICVYWIVVPASLILLTNLFASFQTFTGFLGMLSNLLYINVLRGFNDLTNFGITLFGYFSEKGYPIIPAVLCLSAYGIGRLFAKPQKNA